MTRLAFENGGIVTPAGIRDSLALTVAGAAIERLNPAECAAIDLEGGLLLPGFIDTQVNGGGGALFNDAPTPETIALIGETHARFGTTAFLPTLISDTLDQVAAALDAVDDAIASGVPACIGVHIEGPFLNAERKGIHDARHFRPLDDAAIALLTRPRAGKVMVTLAPERNHPDAIAALTAAGVIVSLGHTNATYDQARAAIEAGARGITHLFNAMSPLIHREPGMVGAALEDPGVYCGLIVDNRHVHPAVLRVALAARPADRMMLVTDAMPSVGNAGRPFTLNGAPIRVEDGVCVDANGTLAGCDLDMATALANTLAIGVPIKRASAMASGNPAAFLGIEATHGRIAIGQRADLVWLGADHRVRGVWIGGERIH